MVAGFFACLQLCMFCWHTWLPVENNPSPPKSSWEAYRCIGSLMGSMLHRKHFPRCWLTARPEPYMLTCAAVCTWVYL